MGTKFTVFVSLMTDVLAGIVIGAINGSKIRNFTSIYCFRAAFAYNMTSKISAIMSEI